MLRRTILNPTWVVILMSGNAALQAGEVNVVVSLIVTDPPAYIAAVDKWFQSEDARGHSLSLFEAEFNGPDPSTHVIVAEFDSYARYQEFIARRRNSPAWQDYVQSSAFVSDRVADGLSLFRASYGEGWGEHPYGIAMSLAIEDPPKYARALERFATSKTGASAPGALILVENRLGGGGPSHFVILTAPDFVTLNEYVDSLMTSTDFARFNRQVSGIRTILGTSSYRAVGRWSK